MMKGCWPPADRVFRIGALLQGSSDMGDNIFRIDSDSQFLALMRIMWVSHLQIVPAANSDVLV